MSSRKPSQALRMLHYLETHSARPWDRAKVVELAREALRESDAQRTRIKELEKKVRDTPKFQGMTELA